MGLIIALLIIFLWATHLLYSLLFVEPQLHNPALYIHIAIQGYLYTGLFITGHDAMHRSVSPNKTINYAIGWISSLLFAGMSYKMLKKNHFKHHRFPATKDDPDFYTGKQSFWVWWSVFMYRYLTIFQIIIMAVVFNVLLLWFSEKAIISFWVIPAFLGTFQLFYFGTYRPHKYPHTSSMHPYHARTQKKNHVFAMLSCYFFGYHYEHHQYPRTPWWKLYQTKSR